MAKRIEKFDNVLRAVEFLQSQGFKISQQKAYRDVKKGLLVLQSDRGVLKSDALAYTAIAGLPKGESRRTQLTKNSVDKSSEEVELIRVKKEKMQFELEIARGLYLSKADVQAELVQKLAAMEAGNKNTIATHLVEWIEFVGGDTKMADALREKIFDAIDSLQNEFCRFDELEIFIPLVS